MTLSITKRTTNRGNSFGLEYTSRDKKALAHTAKWWTSNPHTIYKNTLTPEQIKELYIDNTDNSTIQKETYAIQRRLSKLCRITPFAPLTNARVPGKGVGVAYWLTPAGAELIGASFAKYPSGNIARTAHAWAAADIGTEVQHSLGLSVYSERETATGLTWDGEEIQGGRLDTSLEGSRSRNKAHGKRPDLSILGTNDFLIAGEIELSPKATAYYEKKLATYFANNRVAAVWYFTDNPWVASRVRKAYEELKCAMRDMPCRIMKLETGSYSHRYARGIHSAQAASDIELLR